MSLMGVSDRTSYSYPSLSKGTKFLRTASTFGSCFTLFDMTTVFEEIPVIAEENTEKKSVPDSEGSKENEDVSKNVEETSKKSKKIRSEKQQAAFLKMQETRKGKLSKKKEEAAPDVGKAGSKPEPSDSESSVEEVFVEAPKRRKKRKVIKYEVPSDSSSEEIVFTRRKSRRSRQQYEPPSDPPSPMEAQPHPQRRQPPAYLQNLLYRQNISYDEPLTFV